VHEPTLVGRSNLDDLCRNTVLNDDKLLDATQTCMCIDQEHKGAQGAAKCV